MNDDKYSRSVRLLCPTCGADQFEHDDEDDDTVKCASCAREMTRDELIRENEENIQVNVDEVKSEIKQDFEKSIKDIFKKSKYFTIK
jgi:uncharacterized Zn finger protein (UPF0148 family)